MSQTVSILPDPSDGLVDLFGNGLVSNYTAQFFPVPSALAVQSQSLWYIAQWGQPVALNPAAYTVNNPATADARYGNALYAVSAPGTTASVAVYQAAPAAPAATGAMVYALTDTNTHDAAGGGGTAEADMFLSSPPVSGGNLAHPITLSLDAKITSALLRFASPQLASQYATAGTVFGTFDIGLTVNFNGAGGLPAYSGYVQIVPWTSDSPASANYQNAALTPGDGGAQFISSRLLPGDPGLALLPADAAAAPDTLSYNLNPYIYDTLVAAFAAFSPAQKAALLDMSNWTLGGVYLGPATNDAQVSATGALVQVAQETVGIQLSNINVTSSPAAAYNPSAPAQPGIKLDSNPQISFYDTTIQAGGMADGAALAGAPVQNEYLYTGADNISLTSPAGQNWEFGGGSGFTQLTAISGDNILIAGTGGAVMTGGSGQDRFEIPDANATGAGTADTIVNFHVGDQMTLAGLGGAGWQYRWFAGLSANGLSGLTLLATSTTTPGVAEMVTLAGLSMADLANLRVAPDAATGALAITREPAQLPAYDLATGQSLQLTSDAAPVGLDAEYLYTGGDPMAFMAPAGSNWEFGGGAAYTQLSAVSGNNVFVASTGGSDMVGGSGLDTFLIPDANLTGAAFWDHIGNFHAGDTLQITGLGGPGWSYRWTGAYGTSASPSLTLEASSTITAGLTERVTLTGLSASDLGLLSVTHGAGAAPLIVTHG